MDFIDEINVQKLELNKVKNTCIQLRINIAQNFDDPLEAFVSIMTQIKQDFVLLKILFIKITAESGDESLLSKRGLFSSEQDIIVSFIKSIETLDTIGIWYSNVQIYINSDKNEPKKSLFSVMRKKKEFQKIIIFYDRASVEKLAVIN